MSKKQPVDYALRSEVAAKFERAIADRQLSYSRAAELLQVHRQSLWLYLKKKATPGGEVLGRACRLWEITLSVRGFQFSEDAFTIPEKQARETLPQQLSLLDILQTLREEQLDVKIVGKVGNAFEVKLLIKGVDGTIQPTRRRA